MGCEEELGTAATPAATRTTATGSLAFTGVEVALLLTAGAVLLVVGSALVAAGRRRS